MLNSDSTRFWSKVDKSGGPRACWIWTASKDSKGYGKFSVSRRVWRFAHRIAYELTNGSIPSDLAICHTCDNPSCVNPAHLWPGTVRANNADMLAKGRFRVGQRSGEHNGRAILTEDQVREIKRRLSRGEQGRALAREFGVHEATIQAIKTGRNWGHISPHD